MSLSWLKKMLAKPGGVHLEGQKDRSTQQAVNTIHCSPDTELIIPLQQHRGRKPELLIKAGDHVFKGQPLAAAEGDISVPLHASTSGRITAIEKRPTPHPSGLDDHCIILKPDGKDAFYPAAEDSLSPITDYRQWGAERLRERIRAAGIVGLGGAVFPSAIKLKVRPDVPIETLVINGGECEPYITCDDMLMRDKAEEILAGAQIMLHILTVDVAHDIQCLIGIEDNKPQAIAAMRQAVSALPDQRIQIVAIPTMYPAGSEKQLIQTLTAKEVPSNARPADIGVICHNVATSRAIYRAVVLGEPLISRYVTVSGAGVTRPCNLDVPIGTPISSLIEAAGGYNTDSNSHGSHPAPQSMQDGFHGSSHESHPAPQSMQDGFHGSSHESHPAPQSMQDGFHGNQLVMGGPMMGVSLASDAIPVVKATNCILVSDRTPPAAETLPCIRCGKCAEHCPAGLLPQQLYWYAQARDFEKTESYKLFDCIECGCCAYVCPSHIPLVDYYRFAKTEIRDQRQVKQKAELARERHDFHNERLERAKRERAERLAKHKKKAVAGDKKDAIQAALERAKAKKARMAQEKADQDKAGTP